MYNYLDELQTYCSSIDSDADPSSLKYLDLLIDYIKQAYESTTQRLVPLLENGEITYDLLWALFKPNSVAYTTCSGTKKPRCIKYDSGEEKTVNGVEYFHIEGRYLDFDGEVFGETPVEAGISKFRGAKPINALGLFPLKYHQNKDKIKAEIIECGRKFISLKGTHHLQYRGTAFQMEKGKPVAISISSRIMVDAVLFRKVNPNYTRPSINIPNKCSGGGTDFIFTWDLTDDLLNSELDEAKINTKDLGEVTEDDLLLCSPTVLGFSFDDKLWCKNPINLCSY